jgi:hypothetical protein
MLPGSDHGCHTAQAIVDILSGAFASSSYSLGGSAGFPHFM